MSNPTQSTFPVLVVDFKPGQAEILGCDCGFERKATEDEIGLVEGIGRCPNDGNWLDWKYQIADQCPNCEKLGYFGRAPHDGYCSRVCRLQGEYALELLTRKAASS